MRRCHLTVVLILIVGACAPGEPAAHRTGNARISPGAEALLPSPEGLPAPAPQTPSSYQLGQVLQLDRVQLFGAKGWATVGGSAPPVLTDDGGLTWHRPPSWPVSSSAALVGAVFLDVDRAVVQTSVGFLRTDDRGQSWRAASDPGVAQATFSFPSNSVGWAASRGEPASVFSEETEDVWRSTDGGLDWTEVSATDLPPATSTPNGIPLRCGKQGGIGARDANTAWVAGGCLSGITFEVTRDGGRSWAAQPLPSPAGGPISCERGPCGATAPVFVSSVFGYATVTDFPGSNGGRTILYETYDGGSNWVPRVLPFGPGGVFMVEQADGYGAVAYGGPAPGVYRTRDTGRTWIAESASLPAPFAISCSSVFVCWGVVAGGQGALRPLLVTQDAWLHWQAIVPTYQ